MILIVMTMPTPHPLGPTLTYSDHLLPISDATPTNSDVLLLNSYSVTWPVQPVSCHSVRYIPCFLPATYLSPCCYLLLSCVSSFHMFLQLCLSTSFTWLVFITRILSFQLIYKSFLYLPVLQYKYQLRLVLILLLA